MKSSRDVRHTLLSLLPLFIHQFYSVVFYACYHYIPFFYQCAYARVKQSCLSSARKLPHLKIQASERYVSTVSPSKSAKNWLQYALIPLAQPTNVKNSAFLLATPIDRAYLQAMCFLLMCTTGPAYVGKDYQRTQINAASALRQMQKQHLCSGELYSCTQDKISAWQQPMAILENQNRP